MMRRAILSFALLFLFAATGSAHANLITVTFSTGHTGADTKINVGSTSSWNFQLLKGAPSIGEIVGSFDMKIDGNSPTSNITFNLYDRFNGDTDSSANILGSITLTPASFTNQWNAVIFDITGLNLASSPTNSTNFSVALMSSTPSNKTYHIKADSFSADNTNYINTGTPVPITVPEPSTMLVALGALVPLGVVMGRRRLRIA
jgi:hypothetical protein